MKSPDLAELAVLAIDCQATNSNPETGHLAEIGWVKTRASLLFDHEMIIENIKTYLVKMGRHALMPEQFSRMTGIKSAEMKEAVSKKLVWQRLRRDAKKTAADNRGICPAVIHFRRYEEPYLRQLHQEFSPGDEFPFSIVCTHTIAQRLFPGLPRKSLRAVAGYFGFSLPGLRRSLHHVAATAFIWYHLVGMLSEKEKISNIEELLDWLHGSSSPVLSNKKAREYPMAKTLLQDLPDQPGIYRMHRSNGDLLYIGKAKSIKHRVNSYFHMRGRHAEHILEMLSQAQNLSTSVTQTALEAAVRESDEIKLQSPPYNRALRPNERKILFYSKDLKSKNPSPCIHRPLGPIPSNITMVSVAIFLDVLNGKIKKYTRPTIEAILDTPPGYAPEKEGFLSGLEAFEKEYCARIEASIDVSQMMKWGTQFWQEKLIEKESQQDKEEAQEQADVEVEEGWTPERVFRALKRVNRLGAFHLRRSRWFCRLSESIIRWTTADSEKKQTNLLIIENGIPNFTRAQRASDKTIVPSGHKKTLLDRQRCFDILTYDRMRIVTTEMRRIIQEGRDIELCFHPGNNLNKGQLEKILKWV